MTSLSHLTAEELADMAIQHAGTVGGIDEDDVGIEILLRECAARLRGRAEEWQPISNAPEGVWLRTKRDGENGENVTRYRIWPGGEWEWMDRDGRTTVTHHSFAAPTHWQPLAAASAQGGGEK